MTKRCRRQSTFNKIHEADLDRAIAIAEQREQTCIEAHHIIARQGEELEKTRVAALMLRDAIKSDGVNEWYVDCDKTYADTEWLEEHR